MKYIKMAFISFIVFFTLFTIIGLLFPSNIRSTNAVVINAKRELVLKQLQANAAWVNWYPFFQTNIGAHVDNAAGDTTLLLNDKNELLIYQKRTDSNTVSFVLEDESGRVINHTIAALSVSEDSNQVQVVWNENEKLKWYPWERFRGLVLEKAKAAYLDTVLSRFKQYIDTLKAKQES